MCISEKFHNLLKLSLLLLIVSAIILCIVFRTQLASKADDLEDYIVKYPREGPAVLLGIYVIYTIWFGSVEIDGEINTKGVIGSSLDVVRDVSLMYQNKQSKGLMHRGIASLFSTRNTTVPALEQHFRNGKIGKIFRDIEENL